MLLIVLMALTAVILLRANIAYADPPESGTGTSKSDDKGVDTGDPISANSGALHFTLPLLDLGGLLPLRYSLNYRMDNYTVGTSALDSNFRDNVHLVLERMPHITTGQPVAEVDLKNGDTPQFTYDADSGQWTLDAASPVRYVLKETGADYSHGYYYLMDPIREQVYIFEKVTAECYPDWCPARLLHVMDRNGNRHDYTFTGDSLNPQRIQDGLGRHLDFTYDAWGTHLTHVTDQAGRAIQINYESNAPDFNNGTVLRSVTDAQGYTTTLHYFHLATLPATAPIVSMTLPLGNTPYTQTVADVTLNGKNWARVTAQTDVYSNTTTFAYAGAANRVTETRPDSTTVTYEHYHNDGVPKRVTDATGKTIDFSQSANEQVTQVMDRLGASTNLTFHAATGKLATYRDAEGHTTVYTYIAQSQTLTNPTNSETVAFTFYNLTRTTYADGTHDDFTYDAHGNVLTFADRRGKVWTYTYNPRGQPLTITNPTGGVATNTYNADGTLASSADSDAGSGATTYAYDGYKRLITITRPGGATVQLTYDLDDRLLTVTDERGKTTTFTYDVNGNLDTVANPLNETTTFAQDLMDRLTGVTDPVGQVANLSYDEMGRLETITDRNGHTTSYTYDVRGWRTGVTDPAGQTWTTAYDDEGVPISITTPLGFTTAFQTNKLGSTTRITDALGNNIHFAYDALGRLTTLTDRMGRTTTLTYDATGQLASVTKPVIGTATYTRNDAGLLTRITDLRGKNWTFGYSAMGRLTAQTDPLGRQRTMTYDSRGRLQQITYPGGSGTATYTYDAASNVTQITYSGGPTLNFTYDDAGRLLTANNIALTYDARGDIINSQDGGAAIGATYDDGQRIATVTYDGQAAVTYTYDSRDLLTRVEDTRAGAWMEFAYDNDSRLTGITRSNGVNTTYTYDAAGRVTRLHDGALADQQYTLNAEGEPIQVVRTLPLDPAPGGQVANLSYDDAAQISGAGYAYDARGRQTAAPGKSFGYDGASRLTSVTANGSAATFTYNGLDDLRTRTASGVTTTYYHNYALGLNPIAAEKEGASYKRFYVYTPDGALLYSIDAGTNQARFYHFDRLGSTLFLSDGAGAVSDAYAYDPYGVLLGHTGASDQPFTYVGQYGVRREPVGDLYDMRARAYDPATARFLTRDPVWPVLADPQSLNPYQYAYQSPLRYIDPQGTEVSGKNAAMAAATAAGGAAAGGTSEGSSEGSRSENYGDDATIIRRIKAKQQDFAEMRREAQESNYGYSFTPSMGQQAVVDPNWSNWYNREVAKLSIGGAPSMYNLYAPNTPMP